MGFSVNSNIKFIELDSYLFEAKGPYRYKADSVDHISAINKAALDAGTEGCYAVLKARYASINRGKRWSNLHQAYVPAIETTLEWETVGYADSMDEAKRMYGGAPILEFIPANDKERTAWNSRMSRATNLINHYESDEQLLNS